MTAECPRVMRAHWDGEDNGSHAAQSHRARNSQQLPLKMKKKKGGKKAPSVHIRENHPLGKLKKNLPFISHFQPL